MRLFSIDHIRRQNMVRTSARLSPRVPLFCSYYMLVRLGLAKIPTMLRPNSPDVLPNRVYQKGTIRCKKCDIFFLLTLSPKSISRAIMPLIVCSTRTHRASSLSSSSCLACVMSLVETKHEYHILKCLLSII